MAKEIHLFGIGIFSGLLLAVLFDFFRAFRLRIAHKNLWVSLEDFTYWLFAGVFLFYLLEEYNKGVLRFYVFMGTGIGVICYCLILQKPVFFCFSSLFCALSLVLNVLGKIGLKVRKAVRNLLILPLKNGIKKITMMIHHI